MTLLAKPAARPALFALYAFNYEIAKTREVVTETTLGLIRLQWWRDALTGMFEGKTSPKHQVMEPLAEAIGKFGLSKELLEALIYGREFDLEDRLPSSLQGMANYADYTSTPLLKLAARMTGDTASDDVFQRVGTAYALTGILRATPLHLVQRRCYLPEDLLHKAETDKYALYEGKDLDKLIPIVKAVVDEAKRKLSGLPRQPGIIGTHAQMAAMYLREIERAGYKVYLMRQPPFMALRLWWRSLF